MCEGGRGCPYRICEEAPGSDRQQHHTPPACHQLSTPGLVARHHNKFPPAPRPPQLQVPSCLPPSPATGALLPPSLPSTHPPPPEGLCPLPSDVMSIHTNAANWFQQDAQAKKHRSKHMISLMYLRKVRGVKTRSTRVKVDNQSNLLE